MLTAAGIDEVNELEQNGYLIISSRVGRENHHGEPQFVLATCNPADNWVKDEFYTPWVKGTLPDDHPHPLGKQARSVQVGKTSSLKANANTQS